MQKLLAATLENLYKFDTVRALKDRLRPAKHFLFGKNSIYRWVDQIATNGNANNVRVVFDIGASVGDTALTFLRAYLLPMPGLENKRIKEVEKIEIKLETIDNFVRRENIQKIDLCKIDVEGVEQEVLEGGRETFQHKISNFA